MTLDELTQLLDQHTACYDRDGEWAGCWCSWFGSNRKHPRHQAEVVAAALNQLNVIDLGEG